MSLQLYHVMTDILAMPYYKNQHHQSGNVDFGHEQSVGQVLIKNGFIQQQMRVKKSILKEWAETGNDSLISQTLPNFKPGQFISQPSGSQDFPDFLVCDYNGKFYALECKSGKSACPTWNDNIPKPNAIYIFSSMKYNQTTIFLGKDVISDIERNLFVLQVAAYKKINDQYKKKLSTQDIHVRGWVLNARPKFSQYGGNKKTDYFSHSDRQLCETNVLNIVKL